MMLMQVGTAWAVIHHSRMPARVGAYTGWERGGGVAFGLRTLTLVPSPHQHNQTSPQEISPLSTARLTPAGSSIATHFALPFVSGKIIEHIGPGLEMGTSRSSSNDNQS
jgi:hypothetical protein